MTIRRYIDTRGRARLYLSPDEFARQRRRAKRAKLKMAEACQRAGLPPTSFRRWSSGAASPAPEAWDALVRSLARP